MSASVAGRAWAEGFDAKQVPAGVHWFLHLDVDGFKKTKLGQFALKQAKEFEAGTRPTSQAIAV